MSIRRKAVRLPIEVKSNHSPTRYVVIGCLVVIDQSVNSFGSNGFAAKVLVVAKAGYCAVSNITTASRAETHMAGLISSNLPVASRISTKLIKPKAMPRVME